LISNIFTPKQVFLLEKQVSFEKETMVVENFNCVKENYKYALRHRESL